MGDPYQTSIRNWGPSTPPARTVAPSGEVFVTRDECDRWSEDPVLRASVRTAGTAGGLRTFAVCTVGGYIVDVWQVDRWQSGAPV